MQNLYKKLTLNTLYQFTGKGLNIVLALVTLSILSRHLGVEGMGEYGIVLRYLGFFGIVADLGLNVITTREISKVGLQSNAKILANAFTLRLVTAVNILGFSLILSWFLPYSLEVKTGFFITALAFLFILLTQIFNGVFQKKLITQQSSLADVCAKLVTLVVTVYLITVGTADLLSLLWAIVAGTGLSFAMTWYFVSRHYKIRLRFDGKVWKKFLTQAWPVAVSNALILIYFNVDALMLSWMQPMQEVGLYHVSYKILETVFQFMVLFIGLFVPIFTQSLSQKLHFKKHLQTAFNGVLFFGMPLFFAGVLVAGDLLSVVNGVEFVDAKPILQVLLLASIFLFVNHLMHNTLTVLELQQKALSIYAIGAGFNVVANLMAVPAYGAQGAAYTTLLSELLICILVFFFFLKHQKFYPSVRFGRKILLISLGMFAAMLAVADQEFIVRILLGTVVYFGGYFLFVDRKELQSF